ncbi:MAG: nitronate monooxygenase [Aquabacterium sp.]
MTTSLPHHPSPVCERLGLRVPIVQGPFGGGLSSVALVAAVCEAGGLGSFGVHHLGAEAILATAGAIRQATSAPFALNLWIPRPGERPVRIDPQLWQRAVSVLAPAFDQLGLAIPDLPEPADAERLWPRYEDQIDAVLEARPAVFSFVFGVPSAEVLARCRQAGITTLGAATTPDEARHLEAAGVDMVVATGCEAGGHRVAFLAPPEDHLIGTLSLVPQVRDAVRIPVIAAGGIADARGVAAAMALGADAVQIGTAFLACTESNAGDAHREALFSPLAARTALTRGFSGRLSRGLRNEMLECLQAHPADILPYPVQNWLTGQIKREALRQHRPELMSLWAGQSAPLLRHHDVAALMAALTHAFPSA